jgi:hypothetical protein
MKTFKKCEIFPYSINNILKLLDIAQGNRMHNGSLLCLSISEERERRDRRLLVMKASRPQNTRMLSLGMVWQREDGIENEIMLSTLF